jgi:hypothetical protein
MGLFLPAATSQGRAKIVAGIVRKKNRFSRKIVMIIDYYPTMVVGEP